MSDGDRSHLNRAVAVSPAIDPRFQLEVPKDAVPDGEGDDLTKVKAGLACAGIHAELVTLTRPYFAIPVIKAIAPELQQLPADLQIERLKVAAAQNSDRIPSDSVSLV